MPDWPAPASVRAIQTIRSGGVSQAPWGSLNLGDHVGDVIEHVAANRAVLHRFLPSEPLWLKQVHGALAVNAAMTAHLPVPEADASFSRELNRVCVVMTADCLPVLFCDRAGTVVGAAHAGWRGLLNGVLEQTMLAMRVDPTELLAWMGPAIGPAAFEVGEEVQQAFVEQQPLAASAFLSAGDGKWMADIYALARIRLRAAGVPSISGGEFCTLSDSSRFFSYRRDGITGRMATLIWLTPSSSGV